MILLLGWPLVVGQEEGGGPDAAAGEESSASEAGDEEEDEILEWPALPEWSEEDLVRLRKGELVPGRALFDELAAEEMLPEADPEPEEELPPEPEEVLVEVDPTVIEEGYLEQYFEQTPAVFLVDPQELLARQEYRDRESFLEYHAGDSEVNLYVYLFDAQQQLPVGQSIDSVFEKHFDRGGPTALVFYYLGRPERSEIRLSGSIRGVVSREERERALRTSIQEAFEKTEPGHQLENFSVELSIRLYWFEKAMAGAGVVESVEVVLEDELAVIPPVTLPPAENKALNLLARSLWVVIGVAVVGVGLWVVRVLAKRRTRHVFPEVEIEPLLGAPHAAGVGAVVSFSSAQLPPSQQRDQVPDYLQRM